ncbi:MAG: ABC transporter ATP-binding protein [Arthrospira sp. PLM2.Bin9]|nr:ABC transporter ATP-binding protein [Arthrospira sp. PLM2.Bin9]TVU55368.1 MAG: ABC transporter ATP-binding protein [Arthrospira sp. PLM2.Bin9]
MAIVVLENIYKRFSPANTVRVASTVSPLTATQKEPTPTSTDPDRAVLRNINLTVGDGEFMVFVGPSGCGKSTLLRLIAGLETPTAGKIWIGDRLVNDCPPKNRDVAMVFQNYALYPHIKVYDNLAFGLRRTGKPEKFLPKLAGTITRSLPFPQSFRHQSTRERSIALRVQEIAEILQIEPLLDRFPKQLSGGQKQRVALGRAMARNPQVFLMDEPLSNLDARLRTEMRSQIVELQRKLGTTTIYVTHDQTEAMTMGTRIAVMNGGQIQQIDSPMVLYNSPANRFVAEFIGSVPMNFITVKLSNSGELIHPHFRLCLSHQRIAGLTNWADQSVVLGVRSEHLTLAEPSPNHLNVRVERVEALGHETLLFVRFTHPPEDSLQVRIPAAVDVSLGDKIALAIAPEKVHIFDPKTGNRL